VGNVTLKSNGDEALGDEFLFKRIGDEALERCFSIKSNGDEAFHAQKNCSDEFKSLLPRFIAVNTI
jgi:hypothetical protein